MQATQEIKVGWRIRVTNTSSTFNGKTGTVDALQHDGLRVMLDGLSQSMWFGNTEVEVIAPKLQPSAADDLRLTPQAKIVLSHLKKRQRISPAEALTVYGISRLASCIHEIRNRAGYTVRTEQRRDDHGHKYAKYILAA